MRVHSPSRSSQEGLARRALRLERLPLRPLTVRAMTTFIDEGSQSAEPESHDLGKSRALGELDPGWVLLALARGREVNPLELLASACWWPATLASGPMGEILDRLWRHSVAVALAARSLARDSGDPDPDEVARAGLLSRLGCWAIAAVDMEWLGRWWNETDPNARRAESWPTSARTSPTWVGSLPRAGDAIRWSLKPRGCIATGPCRFTKLPLCPNGWRSFRRLTARPSRRLGRLTVEPLARASPAIRGCGS